MPKHQIKGCFEIGLAIQFLNCNDHLQLTISLHCECYWTSCMSYKVATHCISMQLIAIQLQLCQNHSFSTIMELHYNYSHNVMLTLVIFIHPLKLNTWHYEGFWIFFKILIFTVYYDFWWSDIMTHDLIQNWKIK